MIYLCITLINIIRHFFWLSMPYLSQIVRISIQRKLHEINNCLVECRHSDDKDWIELVFLDVKRVGFQKGEKAHIQYLTPFLAKTSWIQC